MHSTTAAFAVAFLTASAHGAIVFDFESYDDNSPLENGRRLSSVAGLFEQGVFTLSSPANEDPAIFDTDNPGPNSSSGDPDLLVGLGNAVILQNRGLLTQSTSGIYNTPDDDSGGGNFTFNFINPVQLESVDLIDINGSAATTITLTDQNGKTRTYAVPNKWTHDIDVDGPNGYGTLNLLTLAPQDEEGIGGSATASQDAGYDDSLVVSMKIAFNGSAALDNLVVLSVVPTPGTGMVAFGALALVARRRR